MGNSPTKGTRAKISLALKGRTRSPEVCKRISEGHKVWSASKETRCRMEEITREMWGNPEARERRSKAVEIACNTPEVRKQRSETAKALWTNPEYRDKVVKASRKALRRPEVRNKLSKAGKASWNNPECREKHLKIWDSLELREKHIRAVTKALHIKPNKAELALYQLLEAVCPNQYKYTGDGTVIIAGTSPDFTNVNGQKKVIELFGDYWHKGQDPQVKIDKYAEFGFTCLIIWEHELENNDKVMARIRNFQEVGITEGIGGEA